MWKESFIIGIDMIDEQHKRLCDMTGNLLRIIHEGDAEVKKKECISAILFLKDYAATHFAQEEEYQLSISYKDIVAHKALHRAFAATVDKLDQKLKDADYDAPTLKEIAGFLTAWLTYHIAGIDQKLKKQEALSSEEAAALSSYVQCLAQSTQSVLETMTGMGNNQITFETWPGGREDVRIMIGFIGDKTGEAIFTFTREMTFSLIRNLTSLEMTEIDELAFSALCEMTNIISGNASRLISATGKISDIKTPKVISDFAGTDNRSGFYVDTEMGRMAISVNVG